MVVRFSFGVVFPQNLKGHMAKENFSGTGARDNILHRQIFLEIHVSDGNLSGCRFWGLIFKKYCMEIRLSVVVFVTTKPKVSEPCIGYENFFCIIFPVKKFTHEKFLICVIFSAFVKYFTTKLVIRTMHSHRILFGSNLINLTKGNSKNDLEFIGIQLVV